MQEQFVTYEIALKLKELSFDEPCLGIYDFTKEVYTGSRAENFNSQEKVQYIFGNEKNQVILAPLWQQAIDFIEFKHNILIQTEYNKTQKFWIYQIFDYEKRSDYIEEVGFKTKHEAREQAILKAIELIKQN